MNEYILVNLPKSFLTGGWKEVKQPKKVAPYIDHIILSTWSYDHTAQCLKELGFKSGSGGKNIDSSIDNVSVHLKNGSALFTKWSNVKNQCDIKSLHKSDSDLELEMELG